MQRFYTAMRGRITSPGPARPVFRASTDLMLLTQRLRIEPGWKPHIPGSLDIWKNLFIAPSARKVRRQAHEGCQRLEGAG